MQSKIITLLIFIFFHVCIYAQTDKRIALVVGNSEYVHENDLGNAEHDARAISSKLDELGFDVIPKYNLSKKQLDDAIVMFAEKAFEYDVALFYYSGHGAQHNGRNYLIPTGANIRFPSEMEYDCTDAGRVLSMLDESGCKMKIMILDACRIIKQHKYMKGDGAKGLAEMKASTGTFIAYSTGPGHLAYDGGFEQEHSPYASALLNTLDRPGLNILDVFQEVLDQVANETQEQQIPWTSSSFRGRFYFNRKDITSSDSPISTVESPSTRFNSFQISKSGEGYINGHEYVDLGLSVKWATCNLGADRPYQLGDYFAWGEIQNKTEYTRGNSMTYGKSIYDIGGNANLDAACHYWGGSWRLPTKREFEELINNCLWEWSFQNGVYGYRVSSKINDSSIFLPISGCYYDKVYQLGESGYGKYWSSSSSPTSSPPEISNHEVIEKVRKKLADCLVFMKNMPPYKPIYVGSDNRFTGFVIRPVSK